MTAKAGKRSAKKSADPLDSGQKQSSTEMAYREIRRQIFENELPAGFQITEQDLAAKLKVSRTPTREALLRLEGEGLVEIWPRHGMRVKRVSVEDVKEIYEILTALESTAAALAAKRKPPASQIAALRACIKDMDAALKKGDLKKWALADERFHRLLTEASGNSRFVEIVDTYFGQSHRLRMMTLGLRPKPTNSNRDHEAVVKAIAKGDAEAAQRIHRDHREKSAAMLIGLLTRHGLSNL